MQFMFFVCGFHHNSIWLFVFYSFIILVFNLVQHDVKDILHHMICTDIHMYIYIYKDKYTHTRSNLVMVAIWFLSSRKGDSVFGSFMENHANHFPWPKHHSAKCDITFHIWPFFYFFFDHGVLASILNQTPCEIETGTRS